MIQTYDSESDVDLAQAPSLSPVAISCPRTLQNCDNVIIAFQSRRFVIHRFNENDGDVRPRMRAVDQLCKSIREMQPGQEVYYKGRIERLIAIAPY